MPLGRGILIPCGILGLSVLAPLTMRAVASPAKGAQYGAPTSIAAQAPMLHHASAAWWKTLTCAMAMLAPATAGAAAAAAAAVVMGRRAARRPRAAAKERKRVADMITVTRSCYEYW